MVKRIGAKSVFTCIGLEEAMAKYKSYDYDQRMMIPVSLEEPVGAGFIGVIWPIGKIVWVVNLEGGVLRVRL